jgi:hypothetical protein
MNVKKNWILLVLSLFLFIACGEGSKIVDKQAPGFTLDLLDGGQIGITELRGKPVILYFFASW